MLDSPVNHTYSSLQLQSSSNHRSADLYAVPRLLDNLTLFDRSYLDQSRPEKPDAKVCDENKFFMILSFTNESWHMSNHHQTEPMMNQSTPESLGLVPWHIWHDEWPDYSLCWPSECLAKGGDVSVTVKALVCAKAFVFSQQVQETQSDSHNLLYSFQFSISGRISLVPITALLVASAQSPVAGLPVALSPIAYHISSSDKSLFVMTVVMIVIICMLVHFLLFHASCHELTKAACSCIELARHPAVIPILILACMPITDAMRTHTFVNDDGSSASIVIWNGYPSGDFRTDWWISFCIYLGLIIEVTGNFTWTMIQVARSQDIGAPGQPGLPNQQFQSNQRNVRLAGLILSVIRHTSHAFQYCYNNFEDDGRSMFNWLWHYGHRPYSPHEMNEMNADWESMSLINSLTDLSILPIDLLDYPINNLITLNDDMPFDWAEFVHKLGHKLGKTNQEKCDAYLSGFPESFKLQIEFINHNLNDYLFPTHYPARYGSLAGNPHPYAGEPDIIEIAKALTNEWSSMITHNRIHLMPGDLDCDAPSFRSAQLFSISRPSPRSSSRRSHRSHTSIPPPRTSRTRKTRR